MTTTRDDELPHELAELLKAHKHATDHATKRALEASMSEVTTEMARLMGLSDAEIAEVDRLTQLQTEELEKVGYMPDEMEGAMARGLESFIRDTPTKGLPK